MDQLLQLLQPGPADSINAVFPTDWPTSAD